MKFAKNSFIKWSAEDFTYVGQVISHKDGMITFATDAGEMSVADTDGAFTAARKPRNWKKDVPVVAKKVPAKAVRKPRAKSGETKTDLVIKLLNQSPKLWDSRKDAIAAIVAAGISTAAGASTHFNNAKKAR